MLTKQIIIKQEQDGPNLFTFARYVGTKWFMVGDDPNITVQVARENLDDQLNARICPECHNSGEPCCACGYEGNAGFDY